MSGCHGFEEEAGRVSLQRTAQKTSSVVTGVFYLEWDAGYKNLYM